MEPRSPVQHPFTNEEYTYYHSSSKTKLSIALCVVKDSMTLWQSLVQGQMSVPGFSVFFLATNVTSFQSVGRRGRDSTGADSQTEPLRHKLRERGREGSDLDSDSLVFFFYFPVQEYVSGTRNTMRLQISPPLVSDAVSCARNLCSRVQGARTRARRSCYTLSPY